MEVNFSFKLFLSNVEKINLFSFFKKPKNKNFDFCCLKASNQLKCSNIYNKNRDVGGWWWMNKYKWPYNSLPCQTQKEAAEKNDFVHPCPNYSIQIWKLIQASNRKDRQLDMTSPPWLKNLHLIILFLALCTLDIFTLSYKNISHLLVNDYYSNFWWKENMVLINTFGKKLWCKPWRIKDQHERINTNVTNTCATRWSKLFIIICMIAAACLVWHGYCSIG